ncbi:polyketide synthase [Xylaria scruposa]|nr:polyketide synthase [Xylaria scruposa]
MSKKNRSSVDPIAIIGISCRLPGNANSANDFWELLEKGTKTWTPVPPDRFNEKVFYHPSPDDRHGTSHHKGGHFISTDIRDFDHSFFRLLPQQAAAMDPQQRILLEITYEALENSGWSLDRLSGTNTAVYVAAFTADFDRNLYKDPLDMPTYYITGSERAIMSNRISHAFDLRGLSMTLDTACSGSLVSLHQACLGLLDGESDAAIVAAANLTLSPDHYVGMSNLHLISGTGRSYPFDRRGDGYGRGEGCAALILKRLDDALANGDPVRAIICGTAVNQNGYGTKGIVHPNGDAQINLIRTAYQRAGLNPKNVAYVEAHGTGTVAGDYEELSAIAKCFIGPDRSIPLYVGSNKGNIGHSENSSGLASIIKAVLVLDRQIIPPVGGFKSPRPGLPLNSGIRIPTEPVPFPRLEDDASYVSINSFGFGGTNAHVILKREPSKPSALIDNPSLPKLFVFSANSRTSLTCMITAYHDWLDKHPQTNLWSLSYTLCNRRTSLPYRFSCVAQDFDSLRINLSKGGLITSRDTSRKANPYIILVFTGQGAQWIGMGRGLLKQTAICLTFHASIQTSRKILLELGASWDLEKELLRENNENTCINTAELAQPATTAIQIALVALLHAQGVQPQVVVGHSSGEIAAAFAAGYLSHRTALTISYHRGFMRLACEARGLPRGGMISLAMSEHEASPLIGNLTIACVNSPKNITISGDADAIDELATRIDAEGGGSYRRLFVDTAYHSEHMTAVADDYRERIMNCDFTAREERSCQFISSVSGAIKSSGFGSDYWVANLVSPVRFYNAIQTVRDCLSNSPGTNGIFIEIGPHPVLAGPVRQSLEEYAASMPKYEYTSALQRNADAVTSTLTLMGSLFQFGVKLNLNVVSASALESRAASVLSDLPAYAWDHTVKHWYESRISSEHRHRHEPYHDLFGVRVPGLNSLEPCWRHIIDLDALPWLCHHIIDGLVVFPGSGYLCMVFEAVLQLFRERYAHSALETIVLRDVEFLRALVIEKPPKRTEIQLCLKPTREEILAFDFSITALPSTQWYEYCRGTVVGLLLDRNNTVLAGGNNTLADLDVQSSVDVKTLSGKEVYAELLETGNEYGPTFRGCKHLELALDGSHAIANIEIPNVESTMPARHQEHHLIHPATLDIIFHTGLPLAKKHLGPGSVVPVHLDELLICATPAVPRDPGELIQVSTFLTSSRFRTAYADIYATVDRQPVVSVSGMEMRSMAPSSHESSQTSQTQNMCYTLSWKPDIKFMHPHSSSSFTSIIELIECICFKITDVTVVEFCGGYEDLTSTTLSVINAQGGVLSSYICISFTDSMGVGGRPNQQTIDPRVQHVTLSPELSLLDQGVRLSSATLVLVTTVEDLKHAILVVEKSGTILMLLRGHTNEPKDLIYVIERMIPTTLRIQLTFYDSVRNGFVVVMRYNDELRATRFPKRLRVLTHSPLHATSCWVKSLVRSFGAQGGSVTLNQIGEDAISNIDPDICFLVLDDCTEPIVSDSTLFSVSVTLMKSPARVLWVCPDTPPQMYQITGLSRSAHAENDQLRLITMHVARNMLEDDAKPSRLADILTICLTGLTVADTELQPEREYQVRAEGNVLVPRLHRHQYLNTIVTGEKTLHPEIETRHFMDYSRPLILSSVGVKSINPVTAFADDESWSSVKLDDDEMEIEARAIQMTSTYRTASFGAYAGTVARAGMAVKSFTRTDRVVAIGAHVCASRPRVSQAHAIHLPDKVSFTKGIAFFVDILGACHALHRLVQLEPSGQILIYGALSLVGRAVFAVARSIGTRILVAARDGSEVQSLIHGLSVAPEQVIIARPSQDGRTRARRRSIKLDVIVQASDCLLSSEIIELLKPFGSIIFMDCSINLDKTAKIPPNITIHSCVIAEVLKSHPQAIANLTRKAKSIFDCLPTHDLVLYSRDVGQIAEAVRLLDTGAYGRLILTAEGNSTVQCITSDRTRKDKWRNHNASYVIAGGLGDLGKRVMCLMARRGAKHLVTLTRTVVENDELQEFRAKLEKIRPGCRLYCMKCDITSGPNVARVATALSQMGIPPVQGVIQSAAILQDRTLDSMTYDDFLAASQIKVNGTIALVQAFTSPHLAFVIMLSSAANIVGTSGQGNYNAGNAVEDAMAQNSSTASCQFISLNIGWVEDAVATVNSEPRRKALERAGFRIILHDELSWFLDYALGVVMNNNCDPQIVIGFDHISLARAYNSGGNGNIHSALFRHVYNKDRLILSSSTLPVLSFKDAALKGDRVLLIDFVAVSIADKLRELFSVDAIRIYDENISILELGLDSLLAIELRNWIVRQFETRLQSSEVILDQTIRMLAEKVVSRSQIESTGTDSQAQPIAPQEPPNDNISQQNLTEFQNMRPEIPLPRLEDTLHLFQESRRAVGSKIEQESLSNAITSFLDGTGLTLQRQLEAIGPDIRAKTYENQIYLQRREPLQDYSLFSFIHPMEAPTHSQAMRAAVLTAATIEYGDKITSGVSISKSSLGIGIREDARDWLFHATRRPEVNVDRLMRFPPNRTVVVLHRGHVFQLTLGDPAVPLNLPAIEHLYATIINSSAQIQPRVCTLTADERNTWALLRDKLEHDPNNAAVLTAIDEAAFVVCLDDESPTTADERLTQFLINGHRQPFSNRWLDKPVQLVVASNGLSAGIHEHSKIDGLDVRELHRYLIRALMLSEADESSMPSNNIATTHDAYCIRELIWNRAPIIDQRIKQLEINFILPTSPYCPLGHKHLKVPDFGRAFLRGRGASPNATAHLVVILAIFLVDGHVRPAWEIVSLSSFARGRIDWVQTVSQAVRDFLEEALAIIKEDNRMDDDSSKLRVRSLFLEAARFHSKMIALAAQGRGYVNHLYALRGIALEALGGCKNLPALFRTDAWNATRRGGTGQDIKIGFEPSEEEEEEDGFQSGLYRWKEAGFLMAGEQGVYVHCDVSENYASFFVSAEVKYAAMVYEALKEASALILKLVR